MYRYPEHSGRGKQFLFRASVLVLLTLLLLVSLIPLAHATDYGSPGPYAAGWRRVTITRADRSAFTARLYYPARARGQDAPYDKAAAPYPAIAFGHGYQINPSFYASTLEHLATWGYLVCAPESGLELFPSHQKFADDLSRCLTYLEQENGRKRAWLYEQVDTARFGVSGHSMGAGAGILAASSDPRIRAVANMAAAETNPSAVASASGVGVPVRMIVASADGIVGPSQTANIFAAAKAPRQLSVIQDGSHCGFLDSNYTFCDAGVLPRPAQLAQARRLLTAFFNLYLKGDQGAWTGVWGPDLRADPVVRTQADAGIAFAAAEVTDSGPGGGTVVETLVLTNTGPRPVSFTLFFEDNAWQTAVSPAQTGVLDPGSSTDITVRVTIPTDATAGAEDSVTVSARSDSDGGTRSFTRVVTEAK